MTAEQEPYLAVLKASYDYEPQPDAEDELAIKENQLLFLLERTDEEWWKVKVKSDSQEEDSPSGLVPAAYVEVAEPIHLVKVLYDYDATQATELSVKEDEILNVYDKDEEWLLVASQSEEGRVGYVPGNYVEETSAEAAATPASVSSIVVPDSPPRPARPVSTYVDPADRVAAASNKAQADSIQTWSVSEVDAKGKKKKGTLGIGNGAMFFASESDKNPVRKWPTSDVQSVKLEKSKHVHIDVGGADAASLHFHAGSKDTAEAIMTKLESSRSLANGAPSTPPAEEAPIERPRSSAQKSVHFAQDEPDVIPAETYEEEEDEEEAEQSHVEPDVAPAVVADPDDGLAAVVLYNFDADGEDEMTVHEGETLVVLERDSEEWWKCRNASGAEGVVPASYIELVGGAAAAPPAPPAPSRAAEENAAAAAAAAAAQRAQREAEKREEAERREAAEREKAEKKRKQEAELRAKAAAAVAEEDRSRREREREKQKEKERAAAEEEAKRKKAEQRASERKSSDKSRSSSDGRRGPPPETLREWRDRTGQFRVDAAFLGYQGGKLRLHKVNGVVIEVPAEKMSEEDLRYVQKLTRQNKNGSSSHRKSDDDDEPLELRRRSLVPEAAAKAPPPKTATPPKKGPTVDWFEFFLNAGCDVDDCTRYASSFERDKIDEAILPDITEGTMRSLGLREGDIIRVKKAIEQRKSSAPGGSNVSKAREDQLKKDEELARKLQEEENGTSLKARGPAPNLFAGSNGELKTVRRGRPTPTKNATLSSVDLQSITTASDQIQRGSSPMVSSPEGIQQTSSSPAALPPKSGSAAPVVSGFDDDAWTIRPSSTPPARAPSAPPAPPAPPVAPPAPAPPAPAPPSVAVSPPPARAASVASGAPALQPEAAPSAPKTADDEIFNQLARIVNMRVSSPAVPQVAPAAPVAPPRAPSTSISPPVLSTPVGFASGMGMGSSPVPMGHALQAQQTGMLSQSPINAPRGPFAPVPANQSLLQPLVPTTTGFNGFVPTRPGTSPSPFSQQPQQPSLLPQPTGFAGAAPSMLSQPTGFQPQGLMSQPTGMPNGNFGAMNGMQSMPSFRPTPSFTPIQSNPTGFNPMQSNPTGFGSGFGQSPFGNQYSVPTPPPPVPPVPTQPSVNANPANIFAQMKSGTFAQEDNAPQMADKYDALRPNSTPLAVQPTGWGGYGGGMNGFQGGYGYQ